MMQRLIVLGVAAGIAAVSGCAHVSCSCNCKPTEGGTIHLTGTACGDQGNEAAIEEAALTDCEAQCAALGGTIVGTPDCETSLTLDCEDPVEVTLVPEPDQFASAK